MWSRLKVSLHTCLSECKMYLDVIPGFLMKTTFNLKVIRLNLHWNSVVVWIVKMLFESTDDDVGGRAILLK